MGFHTGSKQPYEAQMQNPNPILFSQLPDSGYVRQSQLIPIILPFSSATLWRKVKNGEFPRPVKLSERITAWRVQDIRAWMQKRQPEGAA